MLSPRDTAFDILKGIGILEVILHHVLGYSARKYAVVGTTDWWAMTVANRILHFAVPLFLMTSALLLARSLASKPKPDWKRFYRRRAERTLWPYLVWSLIYITFRIGLLRSDADLSPTLVSLPLLGNVTLPALLAEGAAWRSNLLWGKAYYHLYFMVVLLQFSLLFPLFYCSLRRVRLRFGGILLVSALLQLLAFSLHAQVFYPVFGFTTPASSVLWYLPPVLIGVWLGVNWNQWFQVWNTWRWPLFGITFAGFGVYMTLSVRQVLSHPISSLSFNIAYAAYAAGVSLLLLAASQYLVRGSRVGRGLGRIGDWSLPLFLAHPLVLFFLGGPRISSIFQALPASACWVFVALFVLTWSFTAFTGRLHLDRLLFGRSLVGIQR
jgi:peptidoglycan/LPS O-acetylase OafA/YrhL